MKKKIIGAAALLAGGTAAVLAYRENHCLQKEELSVRCPHLPSSFDGLKIVHLSDLHNARFGKGQQKLLTQLRKQRADMVLISGDLSDRRRMKKKDLLSIQELVAGLHDMNCPVYYTPGNHEAASPLYPDIKEMLSAYGVRILEDEGIRIYRGTGSIALAGLKDWRFFTEGKQAYIEELGKLRQAVKDEFCILLIHRPEYFDVYAACGYDAVFCGHAHGGQIRLGKGKGIYAPGQGLFPRYSEGMYEKNGCCMFVSRGLGSSGVSQRVYNRPHLLCVTLHAFP